MAMRKSIRRELNMLREFFYQAAPEILCYFCDRALFTPDRDVRYGNRNVPPVPDEIQIAIHHINGNHDDNRPSNRAPAHQLCHKRHHANLGGWRKHER